MVCVNPREVLFNDFSDQEAEKWMKGMKTQPAEGWAGITQYCGWKDLIASARLAIALVAALLDPEVQMAQMAGSKIERCEAGHMVMLRMPGRVVEVIRGVVEG